MAGNKKSKYMAGGGKSTKGYAKGGAPMSSKFRMAGGGATELDKDEEPQTYKAYVQNMFGSNTIPVAAIAGRKFGGDTSMPALKKKRTKGMAGGGKSTKGMAKGGKN